MTAPSTACAESRCAKPSKGTAVPTDWHGAPAMIDPNTGNFPVYSRRDAPDLTVAPEQPFCGIHLAMYRRRATAHEQATRARAAAKARREATDAELHAALTVAEQLNSAGQQPPLFAMRTQHGALVLAADLAAWADTAPAIAHSTGHSTFDAGQPITSGDLIEDSDGAPLPHELQRGGTIWLALFDGLLNAVTVNHATKEADALVTALAPILWPLLPSNTHRDLTDLADRMEALNSTLCDCTAQDGNTPRSPTTGLAMPHHCECRAVLTSEALRDGATRSLHAQACSGDHRHPGER